MTIFLKVEHELLPKTVPAVAWTLIQCEECAQKNIVDLITNVKRHRWGATSTHTSSLGGMRSSEDAGRLLPAQLGVNYQVHPTASTDESRAGSIYDSLSLDIHTQWGVQLHMFERPDMGV